MGALFGGGQSAPAMTAPPPPPPVMQSPQQGVNGSATGQGTAAQRAGAAGVASTIITGPQGLSAPPTTTNKSQLGA